MRNSELWFCRVKRTWPRTRTNTTPPQREESPERRQCRFHSRLFGAVWGAQPQRTPRRKHCRVNAAAQRRTKATPSAPFPPSPVTRRDRRQKTAKPKVNPQRQITAPTPRERANGDLDPAEQERKLSQAVLFVAMRQTAGVNRGKARQQKRETVRETRATSRQNRNPGREPSANSHQNHNAGREPKQNATTEMRGWT